MTEGSFFPPRQRGLIVLGILLTLLASIFAWSSWNASQAEVGPTFLLQILLTLAVALPLPLIAYRTYALIRANYHLGRDKLIFSWGLRIEEIPLSDIEWVRPATDLTVPLRLPPFRLPGSILGLRRHPDLGTVEFLASDVETLLLVATAKRVFAISPADPRRFARDFQLATELGSLASTPAISTYPSFIVVEAWNSLLARYLWLSGLLLNIGLLAWTSILIPGLESITLGFNATGVPHAPFPPVQLMLLPFISFALFVVGWIAGLYFYRWEEQQILAFIIWASGTLTGILFLVAVLFAITPPT
ncbi:MAG: hypothetical protein HQ525_05005 [Anaerolineae bacterium]|nr:hypothetical protein [Anaerolineae bacterium]